MTIPFPERREAVELERAYDRMREIDELCRAAAELLYRAKAIYRQDVRLCLPWDVLTPGQRRAYCDEVRTLVVG